jgi:hypothetical protein
MTVCSFFPFRSTKQYLSRLHSATRRIDAMRDTNPIITMNTVEKNIFKGYGMSISSLKSSLKSTQKITDFRNSQ